LANSATASPLGRFAIPTSQEQVLRHPGDTRSTQERPGSAVDTCRRVFTAQGHYECARSEHFWGLKVLSSAIELAARTNSLPVGISDAYRDPPGTRFSSSEPFCATGHVLIATETALVTRTADRPWSDRVAGAGHTCSPFRATRAIHLPVRTAYQHRNIDAAGSKPTHGRRASQTPARASERGLVVNGMRICRIRRPRLYFLIDGMRYDLATARRRFPQWCGAYLRITYPATFHSVGILNILSICIYWPL
jgi:hypothetical protein